MYVRAINKKKKKLPTFELLMTWQWANKGNTLGVSFVYTITQKEKKHAGWQNLVEPSFSVYFAKMVILEARSD